MIRFINSLIAFLVQASVSGISAQALRGNGKVSRQEWGGVYRHCASSSGALFARLARTLRRSACGFSPECLGLATLFGIAPDYRQGLDDLYKAMGINELPSPPLLVEPKPEGRASRVRGGGSGVSGRPGLEMPYTHTPTLAALLECGHCGKSQGIPEPPDRGSRHFGAWQTAPHQESFERTDKPNLTGVSRCLTDSLLLGYLAAATAVLLPGPLQRGYGVLSDSLGRARQIRPSAKRQTWLPPGPWSTPRVVSTDYQTSSPTKQVL